ncbi:hypothetical protein K439DRAFT_378619 [Ramaria rubella]|nr:hypothetical protein K439DRAFT_378619 [Ramaria rubella]
MVQIRPSARPQPRDVRWLCGEAQAEKFSGSISTSIRLTLDSPVIDWEQCIIEAIRRIQYVFSHHPQHSQLKFILLTPFPSPLPTPTHTNNPTFAPHLHLSHSQLPNSPRHASSPPAHPKLLRLAPPLPPPRACCLYAGATLGPWEDCTKAIGEGIKASCAEGVEGVPDVQGSAGEDGVRVAVGDEGAEGRVIVPHTHTLLYA